MGEITLKLWKRLSALLLCAAAVSGLVFAAPASASAAAAPVSVFPDITDAEVGRAVEILRTMGVVEGSKGKYRPDGSLTRAEFCKLAILVMGLGDQVSAYKNKTIFPDVSSKHWARGYVNMAASDAAGFRLMVGMGNGKFAPDKPITYGEAVTVILRILKYSSAADSNWPNGAVSAAARLGLSDNLGTVSARGEISRGQAAILFCNMLTTPSNGSSVPYAEGLGSLRENVLLTDCDTVDDSGKSSAVELLFTENNQIGKYQTAGKTPADFLQGSRGSVLLDQDGRFLTFLPDRNTTCRTIVAVSATSGSRGTITAADGSEIRVASSVKVWNNDSVRTYGDCYGILNRGGATVTVYFNAAGQVDYLYVNGVSTESGSNVMVARDPISGNPFAGITGGVTGYTILRNGTSAASGELRQYDVGVFDSSAKVLYVTDFRLTGVYEGANPNPDEPSSILFLGKDFDVLECAVEDLQKFKVGDTITVLFTPDGKVAGAANPAQVRSTAVGTVDPGSTDDKVTVHLLGAPSEELAAVSGTCTNVNSYKSSPVSISGGPGGALYLGRASGSPASSALDVSARTVGGDALADTARVFERVGSGALAAISLDDIAVSTVPAEKIVFLRKNNAGKIDLLVLNDVTGDRYTYGIVKLGTQTRGPVGMEYTNTTATVTNRTEVLTTIGGVSFLDGAFVGLAASTDELDDLPRVAGSVALKSVAKVNYTNFNLTTLRFFSGSVELPVWDGVQCYDARTSKWLDMQDRSGNDIPLLERLNEWLSASNDLTVWYDRDPGQGGKVRVIVLN